MKTNQKEKQKTRKRKHANCISHGNSGFWKISKNKRLENVEEGKER